MNADERSRKPQVFDPGDARLERSVDDPDALPAYGDSEGAPPGASQGRAALRLMRFRGIGWGAVFLGALGGLASIGLSIWIADFVGRLFSQSGWLGYLALALALLAALAAAILAAREILGYFRLGRIAAIRLSAEAALADDSKPEAESAARQLERLLAGRGELRTGVRNLAAHRREVLDPAELLTLAERELLLPLDRDAKRIVSASVRRVALITAVSPSAIFDVAFVAVENLAMLRRLASLYGGRPGFIGSLKLARLVLGHLALTGGVALGDDVIQQLIGHGLTARLSARLGEGVLNGAFTGRVGIAAMDLCRPLPYIEAERPKLRSFLAGLGRIRGASDAPAGGSGAA